MPKVLVVEDNLDLLDDMLFNLQHSGFDAKGVGSAKEMESVLAENTIDILILDLGLPDDDGFYVAERLKKSHPNMGIIMATARSSMHDRITGHQLGADQYLTKPVNYQELVAIIHVLSSRLINSSRDKTQNNVHDQAWELDMVKMQVTPPSDLNIVIELTLADIQILASFRQSKEGCVSKPHLIQALGGDVSDYDVRRLETAISRLRRKLSVAGIKGSDLIKVQRGSGYQFTEKII